MGSDSWPRLRSEKDGYFFHSFLPPMASIHTSMNYNISVLKNHRVHNLLAWYSSTQTCWQWVGPKFHSLLSTHHVMGAYFLTTTESDKCMRLLTRLYGILVIKTQHYTHCIALCMCPSMRLIRLVWTDIHWSYCKWCHVICNWLPIYIPD